MCQLPVLDSTNFMQNMSNYNNNKDQLFEEVQEHEVIKMIMQNDCPFEETEIFQWTEKYAKLPN